MGDDEPSVKDFLNSMITGKGKGAGLIDEMVKFKESGKIFDFRVFFTDDFTQGYLVPMLEDISSTKDAAEKEDLQYGLTTLLEMYAAFIYYYYPKSSELKESISSDKELSANFEKVKQWVDQNGGKSIADGYIGSVKREAGKTDFVG